MGDEFGIDRASHRWQVAALLSRWIRLARGSSHRAGMTIDLSNLPQQVRLAVGERTEIPLPSYADSGNIWSATCLRGHGVARVSIELGEHSSIPDTRGNGTTEPPPLMLVPERAVVSGLAIGEADWRLVLSRSFGAAPPAATHEIRITVLAV